MRVPFLYQLRIPKGLWAKWMYCVGNDNWALASKWKWGRFFDSSFSPSPFQSFLTPRSKGKLAEAPKEAKEQKRKKKLSSSICLALIPGAAKELGGGKKGVIYFYMDSNPDCLAISKLLSTTPATAIRVRRFSIQLGSRCSSLLRFFLCVLRGCSEWKESMVFSRFRESVALGDAFCNSFRV